MKRKYLFLLFLLIILFPLSASADSIYNIDMYIEINKDGSADIEEKWHVKADSGTEWYKQLYNLGNEKISNYTVSMDDKPLKYKTWNIDETLDEKNGYYGINETSEGIELCFGKGDMQTHTFTLSYTLSNFIFNTDNNQVLYQTLFPNVTMDSFTVEITSYYPFPDTLPVWGYGYMGYAYVKDGKIQMSSEEPLYNDYVVLLAKFPAGTFDNDNYASEYPTFTDVITAAEDGTYAYDYENGNGYTNFFETIASLIPFIITITGLTTLFMKMASNGYGYQDNKKINKKEVPL